jgi:bacteriorhodopsin
MRPLDPPMVPFALAGTAIWAVAGVVMLLMDAPADWLWTCLAGFAIGCALLVLMLARDRRRRRSTDQPRR